MLAAQALGSSVFSWGSPLCLEYAAGKNLYNTHKTHKEPSSVEHMPELILIPLQGLSLAKEGHPLFTAASMMEGEMGNAGGWGSF